MRRCRDPYCANNPYSRTYEAVTGFLCGSCESASNEEERNRPRHCDYCGEEMSESVGGSEIVRFCTCAGFLQDEMGIVPAS